MGWGEEAELDAERELSRRDTPAAGAAAGRLSVA